MDIIGFPALLALIALSITSFYRKSSVLGSLYAVLAALSVLVTLLIGSPFYFTEQRKDNKTAWFIPWFVIHYLIMISFVAGALSLLARS
jgi:hypothetical protein